MIVADSNLVVYLLIPGEHTAAAEAVYERDASWAAPLLWRSELRNVLSVHVRAGRISLANALESMRDAESLLAEREYEVPSAAILRLASESRCSAYDCEFVHLARELAAPLVTSDRKVLRAFPDIALSMGEFVAG